MTFLFTWLYMKTKGSLLIAILLHASINAAIKFIPILPPELTSLAPFGTWILLLWSVVTVLVFWEWRAWFGRPILSSAMTPMVAPEMKPTLPIAVK
jgi:membrane protease YdiL (CAAX protease family)